MMEQMFNNLVKEFLPLYQNEEHLQGICWALIAALPDAIALAKKRKDFANKSALIASFMKAIIVYLKDRMDRSLELEAEVQFTFPKRLQRIEIMEA